MPNFGERLKFYRQHILKKTRKEFCEKYDIPAISVQSWENNGVKISKTQKEKLEKKLSEDNINFDLNWLFLGGESPWEIFNKKDESILKNGDEISSVDSILKIDNFFYEPLLKRDTLIKYDPSPTKLEDIDCPKFILLKDSSGIMHFGILTLTMDKKHLMEAFQGHFYKLVPDTSDSIYVVNQILLKE